MASAATSATLEQWALPRLQQLLPLDEESVKQVIQYADSLSKDEAAEHLKNLLGDDAKALEFISSFNLRRQNAPTHMQTRTDHDRQAGTTTTASDSISGVSKASPRKGVKKKPNIHVLPARQIEDHGQTGGGYVKSRNDNEYIPRAARENAERQKHQELVADNMALREKPPDATKMPLVTDDASLTTRPITSKAPPSAAGPLVSDSLSPRKTPSTQSSRNVSPAPKAKVNIAGGTPMHGASSSLSDLDSAIRSLEIQTNPSLSNTPADDSKRQCNCMATRHPLLDIAPNCQNCGKIICVKQGLGPCTFCHNLLLSQDEIAKVLRVLKEERGEERMKANNAAHKKADVSYGKSRALTGRDFLAQSHASSQSGRSSPLSLPSSSPATPAHSDDEASTKAKEHRDKLLNFQAQNARRTQIRDEAADYDIPTTGSMMWASPSERAQQLKKQQKILREMEWNARPEYEKRKVVASIDVKGGRVVRRMAPVEKPSDASSADEAADAEEDFVAPVADGGCGKGGAFSNNPLAKGLIKPKAREEKGKDVVREKRNMWRRVQNDDDDNEAWILDGGIYGGQTDDRVLGAEERAFR